MEPHARIVYRIIVIVFFPITHLFIFVVVVRGVVLLNTSGKWLAPGTEKHSLDRTSPSLCTA